MAMSQQYVFAQLKGAYLKTDGWNLSGDAQVANVTGNNLAELLLCTNNRTRSGAAFYSQPINLSICNKWKAEFDFRIFDGTGADGLAFCFLDVAPSGYVNGGGLGIPATANGLKVCFDTWRNCSSTSSYPNMPKLEIRWGVGYDECSNLPTRDNQDGKLSIIRNAEYCHAMITYDNGNISVFLNDNLYLTGFQQFNFAGYLGFTASTGGSNDNHSIKNVMIYTEMPPSFAGNPAGFNFCPKDSVKLGGSSNSEYIYSWYPTNGLSDSSAAAPLLNLPNNSGNSQQYTYYVKTAFKNNPGCASKDSVPIRVYPNPAIQLISPEICLQDAVAQFADSSFTKDNSTLPFLYKWNFGDPAANTSNPNNSVQQNPSHRYSASGNYPIKLQVTNSKGCTDSISKIFTVNGAIPEANFSITNPTSLCSNQPVEIINESVVDFGNITKVQIFWGDTASKSYIDESPSKGKKYTHQYPNSPGSTTSNYSIKLVAFSGISCEQELSKPITILPSPILQFTNLPSLCNNSEPIDITGSALVNNLAGIFSYSGKGVTANGQFNPKLAIADTQYILFTYTATNSCKDSGYQKIIITPSPIVNAGPDLMVLKNEPVQINATATGNGLQYKWTPSAYLNSDVIINPLCTTAADIVYELTATDNLGCSSKSSMAVKILRDPLIPSAFTPNGDGLNDLWRIKELSYYPNCEVTIYDRYGQLVYYSKGYKNPWDGTKNGQPMTAGTYCYLIDTKKLKTICKGFVVLLR